MISRWAGDSFATQARRIALVVARSSEASGVRDSSAISRTSSWSMVLETPLAQRGQRLEARDRQQPGGNLRAALELARGAPDVEEYLADQVFRHGGIADDAQDEAVNPYIVTGE